MRSVYIFDNSKEAPSGFCRVLGFRVFRIWRFSGFGVLGFFGSTWISGRMVRIISEAILFLRGARPLKSL